MPTTFVKGDLFQQGGRALAHGCNCAGAMGKGIALEFRARFPKMYAEYKQRCADGRFGLGDVFTWSEGEVTVFNLGTQKTWRSKAEMQAIQVAVAKMIQEAEARRLTQVALPRIGAGLGGLPWEPIRALLAGLGEGTSVHLLVFEEFVPGAVAARP